MRAWVVYNNNNGSSWFRTFQVCVEPRSRVDGSLLDHHRRLSCARALQFLCVRDVVINFFLQPTHAYNDMNELFCFNRWPVNTFFNHGGWFVISTAFSAAGTFFLFGKEKKSVVRSFWCAQHVAAAGEHDTNMQHKSSRAKLNAQHDVCLDAADKKCLHQKSLVRQPTATVHRRRCRN